MAAGGFEHLAVHQNRLYVSVCRECLRFIAAAPDAARLAAAEAHHDCSALSKKPPARVLLHEVSSAEENC